MADHRIHYRTCNLCEAMCGLEMEIAGDRVLRVQGDAADSFSRGYHCIKGEALADLHADPNRLKVPLRRTKSDWEEISWDVAVREVAENIHGLQKRHGRDALATYIGNPNVHNYGSLIGLQSLLRELHTRNRFAATSSDQLPHHLVAFLLYGHQLLLPVPDIDRTHYMLILGANPVVSRGSMMTAPDVTVRLKDIQKRGGKVVLIDPRRTETAAVVDAHHFIRPGTDGALLAAMIQVVFAENLTKLGRLTSIIDDIEQVRAAVTDFTPELAASVTGVGADTIRTLAREFAGAESAVCYGRVGVSTQEFGTLCQWLVNVLNVITGNLDRPGGAMFTTPALDPLPYVSRGHFGKWRSRVRGLPEFAGELPVAALTEEMTTAGPGQIKGLVTSAGNPVLSTPNGAALERALGSLEYMVSFDIYLNETTRFARHILPPTAALEHENYDAAFHVLAVRNTAKFSEAAFVPAPDARHDWQILGAVERHLKALASRKRWAKAQCMRWATPERLVALGLRFGPHGQGFVPFGKGLTLGKVRRAPHGIDLGPLEPRLPARLFTRNKRIALAPVVCIDDLKRLRRQLVDSPPSPNSFDLRLIGRRQVRVNNSWMGQFERLTKGKPTFTAVINPEDAASRGIKSGDLVRITSRVGALDIKAVVASGIMQGVVSVPHGFGHTRPGTRLDVALHAKGVSVNDITDASMVDELSGNAIFNGVPIRLERVLGPE